VATASTDTWSQSRDEIIKDALSNLGELPPDGTPQGPQLLHASRALNRIVKALDAEGQFLWRITRETTTTTSATASYALDANAFDVDGPMTYLRSGETGRTQILPMTRDDYMSISDRTQAGVPSRYYLERSLSGDGINAITAYFWPVPDATGDTIEYPIFNRAKDLATGAQTPDFPTNWALCLVYALTAELAPTYAQPQLARQFREDFEREKTKQLQGDNEKQDLVLVPFGY
jgi:hypothetical protein